ncbi:MAG: hypothetical protein CVV64_12675 [Candidatus Wallbacteria bacterium HGW-Wallbacteria-1]|jgi:predicted DNA-binding ribbon-helix-helix protein|uniref:Uncharacterized protein n=1 Tax=Candidatus Wallbacteria bacterium HGW-Wallbacteria-1 TaxID=2013854 RepID=A0A2N1PN56_9BACT|nr:MAG: hypothetical protein CVV64_12675 [Candidatus Wallbacteria bacterium HGW-Wallbacteria-1]
MKTVERVQTGVRMEKNLIKVLKGLAEYHEVSMGDLMEGIVLHVFEGKTPFSKSTLDVVKQLSEVYGLTSTASDSHNFKEICDER